MPTVTWNPADKDPLLTLSGGNLTVTMSADTANSGARVRATLPSTSGNYFEYLIQGTGGSGNAVGVQYGTQGVSEFFDTATGIGWAPNGYVGGPSGWIGYVGYTFGDTLGFYIGSDRVDIFKNGTFLGYYLHSLTVASLYPFVDYGQAGRSGTANFGASAMAFQPTGAVSWDGSRTGGAVGNITVSQLLSAINQTAAATVVPTDAGDIANITVAQLLGGLQQDIQIGGRNISASQVLGPLIQVTAPAVLAVNQGLGDLAQIVRASPAPIPPFDPTAVDPASVGTVNGTALVGSGTSGSPIVWPSSLLQADNVMFARRGMSRSGGQAISGVEQLVASATDFWEAQIRVRIRRTDQANAFRALMARADGRASNWLVPTCSNVPRTITIPGTPGTGPGTGGGFSSGFSSGFDVGTGASGGIPDQTLTLSATFAAVQTAAALRARSLRIRMAQTYQVPGVGQYFSIGSRLYMIGSVTAVTISAGTYDITFSPGLRTAVAVGASLDFQNPKCRMRLADDSSGQMALDMLRFADVQLSFVEIPA